jgi:hypothetical protein
MKLEVLIKIYSFQRLAETFIICVSGRYLGKFSVEYQFAKRSKPGGLNQLKLEVLIKIYPLKGWQKL